MNIIEFQVGRPDITPLINIKIVELKFDIKQGIETESGLFFTGIMVSLHCLRIDTL